MILEISRIDKAEIKNEMENQFPESETCNALRTELELIKKKMFQVVQNHESILNQLENTQRLSCENLLFYLILRSEDIRDLQYRLHILGLSSLASSESHIYSQMNAVLERLGKIIPEEEKIFGTYADAIQDIKWKSEALFGVKKTAAVPNIMVTLDSNFVDEVDKLKEMMTAGMNLARINCAHDDEQVWVDIIDNIRQATDETGLPCKIYMDLAGPKIRTILPAGKGKNLKIHLTEGEHIFLAQLDGDMVPGEKTVGCTIEGII